MTENFYDLYYFIVTMKFVPKPLDFFLPQIFCGFPQTTFFIRILYYICKSKQGFDGPKIEPKIKNNFIHIDGWIKV